MRKRFLILPIILTVLTMWIGGLGVAHAVSPAYTLTSSVIPSFGGMENSMSVNPASPLNVQVIYYNNPAYSNDNGATFTALPAIGASSFIEDPYISVGANGTSYGINGACFLPIAPCQVSKSSDGGATWRYATPYGDNRTIWTYQNGTSIGACPTYPNGLLSDYAKLAADPYSSSPYANNVYVLGAFFVGSDCHGILGLARSADGGNTWNLHRAIYPPFPGWNSYEKLVIGSDGTLYFAVGYTDLYLVYSKDAGSTWSSYKDTLNLAYGMVRPPLAIGPNSSIYFAVNTKSISGTYQIYLIKTNDGGLTFSVPVAISDPAASVYRPGGNNVISPTITVNPVNSNVFVGWRDWRNSVNDTQMDVYAYSSFIGGSNLRLTPVTGYCRTLTYYNANTTGATASCRGGNDYMDAASNNYSDFIFYGITYNAYYNPSPTQTLSRLTFPRISANPSSVTMTCHGQTCSSSSPTVTLTGYPTGTTATLTYGCVGSCTNNPHLTGPSTVSITGTTLSFPVTVNQSSKIVAGTWTLTVTATDGSISLTAQITVHVVRK